MGYVTIPDRVPVETIAGLTNAALRVYLERHGWPRADRHTIEATWNEKFEGHAFRMSSAIADIVNADNLRSADVIAELQAVVAENATSEASA